MAAAGYEPTFYQVLGVVETASVTDIRAAYRSAARTRHPDAGGSEVAMQELNVAWHALRDPADGGVYEALVRYFTDISLAVIARSA